MRCAYSMLLIALCMLAGCGRPDVQQTAAAQITPAPSITPAAPSPSIVAPSTIPQPTATFVATIVPPTPTTIPPTATLAAPTAAPPTPTAIPPTTTPQPYSPADLILRSGGENLLAVAADGSSTPIRIEGISIGAATVSPDGVWIAGPAIGERRPDRQGPENGLIVYNRANGTRQTFADGAFISLLRFSPDNRRLVFVTENYEPTVRRIVVLDLASGRQQSVEQSGTIYHMHFAPDSSAVVFSTESWETMIWQLNVLDLASGQQRTLRQGNESLGYLPSAWLPQGILAYTYLIFGADGGPESLYLIDPADGSVRELHSEGYIYAEPSPDGEQIAIVTGQFGLGIENPTFTLSLRELASDQSRLIEPERSGGGFVIGWSPDSEKLLYRQSDRDGQPGRYALTGPNIAEPIVLELPFATSQILHARWRDATTLLLLVEDGDQQKLYALSIDDPDASDLKQLATIPAPKAQGSNQILYAPDK
jgi:dipeptidyl aminopeptidase/acylaminoacyl peptidase